MQVQPAILQAMDWDDLRIFLAVARTAQIARAARLLRIDATTVARRVRRLEAARGEILFEQHSGGQRLTASGAQLLLVAEEIEHQITRLAPQVEKSGQVSGLVRVSVAEGFGTWFVAGHLGRLSAVHPAVSVDLVASSGFLSPSKRETDVAILLARPRKGPLVTRKLTDYGLRVYASRGYLADHPVVMTPADLADHALIGYIPDFIYAPELDYLEEVAPGLQPKLRSSSINAQYRLVRSGAGVGVLPCFIGSADPTLTAILPQIHIKRSFWITTHRDTRNLPPIRHFVDWLVALTGDHTDLLHG